MADPTVVLVPGNFTGPWAWEKVAKGLDQRGIRSVAVDRRIDGGTRVSSDHEHNQRVVREALDSLNGPAILVGHSAGSGIITHAGMHPNVVHLVFLAGASLPGSGFDIAATHEWRSGFRTLEDGSHYAPTEHAVAFALTDLEQEDLDWAVPQMVPMAPRTAPAPELQGEPAWRVKPSTTVVCVNDRTNDLAIIREYAKLTSESVDWEAGHCPHISQPQLVIDLLSALVDRYR